jgi:hypothetical protein
MKRMIPFGIACMFFCIAAFASWYEGSNLVENPFEWEHTAVITSWLHNADVERANISQFDYFIYSMKFKPIYPIIMLLSFVYIILVLGQKLLKGKKVLPFYVALIGIVLLIGSVFISGSPTEGARQMMMVLMLTGALLLILASASYKRVKQV